ncbi:MAG: hypothetical protein AB7K86_16890 [Rhodospirillales bacterium]
MSALLRRAHRIGAGWLLFLTVAAASVGTIGGGGAMPFAGNGGGDRPETDFRSYHSSQVARPSSEGAPTVTARRSLESASPRFDTGGAAALAVAPAPAWPARPTATLSLPRPDAAPARAWRAGYPRAPPVRAVETPAAA